jgi:hypothetical protein
MRRTPHPGYLLGALLLALACSDDLERQSQLQRVRVLGIRAEPAEVAVNFQGRLAVRTVDLKALTFAPEAQPVSMTYAVCRLDAQVFAIGVRCPGKDGFTLDGGVLPLTDPELSSYLQQLEDGGTIGDGGTFLSDPRVSEQLRRGFPLNIGYLATDGTPGERGFERGLHQLRIRTTRAPNQNPRLLEITTSDGVPVQGRSFPLNSKVSFVPILADGSIETFINADGELVTEQIFYSWFATGSGKVEDFRSQEPYQGAGKRESTYTTGNVVEDVTLYVVVRDGRGGTDWLIRTFSVGR